MLQKTIMKGYCIDTCALVDLWRRQYPPDIFKGLWIDIEELIKKGQLIAPREVYEELAQCDDELLEWASKMSAMFISTDDEQNLIFQKILLENPGFIESSKPINADPFLISLAITKDWPIVTSEKNSTNPNKPKIPDVSVKYNIASLSLLEFFRDCGWEYK
jgi:hypothetical protein